MKKIARKPSLDPIQEKLRQNKSLWNKNVSIFINDLIHFKKLMNGWPSKYLKEKSKITSPIPNNPANILQALTSEFSDLVQQGNLLVEEQNNYSKGREQKKVNLTQPTLSDKLQAFDVKYNLMSEGSNPFTRFLAKLLNPTIGISEASRIRKFRMSLLSACAKLYRDLEKLQAEVVKSSNQSIESSYQHLYQCWNDWTLIARGFNIFKINSPTTQKNEPSEKINNISVEGPEDKSVMRENFEQEKNVDSLNEELFDYSKIEEIIKDIRFALSSSKYSLLETDLKYLYQMIEDFYVSKDKENSKNILDAYNNLLSKLNLKFNLNESSLKGIIEKITHDIEKVSQLFLKKWIGKGIHHLSLFDKTSSFRLDIFKMSEEIRKSINTMMDHLEKDMVIEELDPMIHDINKKMTALRGLMRALHSLQKPRI